MIVPQSVEMTELRLGSCRVYEVEDHHHVLLPWAKERARLGVPLHILTLDHHTDTLPAFTHYNESVRIYNEGNYKYTAPLVSGLKPLEKGDHAPVDMGTFWKDKFKMLPDDFVCEIRKDPKFAECFEYVFIR